MTGKKFFITAAICTALLGIGGTSSAAELSSDFSTLQVEGQELAWGRPGPGRFQPPPPPPPHHRRDDRQRDMRRTGNDRNRGGYGYNNERNRRDTRPVNVNRGGFRLPFSM